MSRFVGFTALARARLREIESVSSAVFLLPFERIALTAMAPAKLSIQTSLRGFPYRRLTSFSAPENDASLSWLKFEEVLQGVCQTWGITRNAKDLVLSAEWGASTFLLDSQEEWHTYCSEFFVPRVDDKSRMQLTIIPRPALPGEYLNTADESGVRSPKLDDHFGDK